MSKLIYLVRHAQPNIINGVKQGLSIKGLEQAKNISKKLATKIDTQGCDIYFAPVSRCHQTADIIGDSLGISNSPANIRFKGIDLLKKSDIQSKFSTYIDNYERLGVESPSDYIERVLEFLQATSNSTVVVVGNYVNMRLLLQFISGKSYESIEHASCFEIVLHDNVKKGTIREIK
jgi:broad specificity phosphatase PhoE